MTASASNGRPPPDPNPPYMFQTPSQTWAASDFLKTTHGSTCRRIIRTPRDPGTLIYAAAANKTTIETQATTTQRAPHHDNNAPPITVLSSAQHPVDNPVTQTFANTKRRIVRTRFEPGTRVYAGVYAAAPTKYHAITTQQAQSVDMLLESTLISYNAKYNAHQQGSINSIRHHSLEDSKPGDKNHQQLQPEDPEPCSDGHNSNTLMHYEKNSALLRNTLKPTNIYALPGYKMDISLKTCPTDSGRHQQPDPLDKLMEEIRNNPGTITTKPIHSNQIHTVNVETLIDTIRRTMQFKEAGIAKHANPKPLPTIPMPTTPPKNDHRAPLKILTAPYLPTADDPRTQQIPSYLNGTVHTATITSAKRPATLYDEMRQYRTLPNQQSRIATDTDTIQTFENYHAWNENSTHTTILAPTTIRVDGATFNRRDNTDTPRAFHHLKDDTYTLIFDTTAHSQAAALVAYLQRLFHPPPQLQTIVIIFAPPNLVSPPTDLSRQHHHQSKNQHQQRITQIRGHKTLTHEPTTMTTTAAANGSKNSKIPADANKEDPKPQKHTAYETRRPPTHTLRSTYQQRKAHLHCHATERSTKNLVQNTHCSTYHTGTYRDISDHSKRYHHRRQIKCYRHAFYVQDNIITAAQKCTKTQPLYTHHFINRKASWNKDSLKPP